MKIDIVDTYTKTSRLAAVVMARTPGCFRRRSAEMA
jgi:hypothetical protein